MPSSLRRLSRVQLALLLVMLMLLWVLSGYLLPSERDGEQETAKDAEPFAVRVMMSEAETVPRYVVLYGRSEANRMVELFSELEGRVMTLDVAEGEVVERAQTLATLEVQDREARLKKAEARVKQRRIDFEAAKKLANKGFSGEIQLAEKKALYEEARADLELARTIVSQLNIRAPFDGIIDRIDIEVGELVKQNQTLVAHIVDSDPIIIHGQVTEFDFHDIKAGQQADLRLADGRAVAGEVRFVSVVAEPETHTFRIEIEVPNPDRTIPVGVTAEIRLPVEQVQAHLVPMSALVLDEKGALGVKTVTADSHVVFYPVALVRDTGKGVWVTGLPGQAQIITLGGSYVSEGEQVTVHMRAEDVEALPTENSMVDDAATGDAGQ